MKRTISAIETFYDGRMFRSRLEARYAVLFDCLGLEYRYEPEKFDLGGIRYIPDFHLTKIYDYGNAFIEIKGPEPTDIDLGKAHNLSEREPVVMFVGDVWYPRGTVFQRWLRPPEIEPPAFFMQCPFCGYVGLQCEGNIGPPHHPCETVTEFAKRYDIDDCFMDFGDHGGTVVDEHTPVLDLAFDAARSMRFEGKEALVEISNTMAICKRLMDRKVFCYPFMMEKLARIASSFSADPRCPRFNGELLPKGAIPVRPPLKEIVR